MVDYKGEAPKEGLEMIQKHFEHAQNTECDRQKDARKTLAEIIVDRRCSGEESRPNWEKGTQEAGQEGQGRACREMELDAGQEILERKHFTEPHVNGSFTEDRGGWEKEPQRHCAEKFFVDPEETGEEQENESWRRKMMETDTSQKTE